jgi:hypothetical protein
MNSASAGIFGPTSDMEMLTSGLTSKSAAMRCMTRGVVAADGAMEKWLNDEISNRKTDPVVLLYALALLQMQTFSSAAAYVLKSGAESDAVELYVSLAQDVIPNHFRRVKEAEETS